MKICFLIIVVWLSVNLLVCGEFQDNSEPFTLNHMKRVSRILSQLENITIYFSIEESDSISIKKDKNEFLLRCWINDTFTTSKNDPGFYCSLVMNSVQNELSEECSLKVVHGVDGYNKFNISKQNENATEILIHSLALEFMSVEENVIMLKNAQKNTTNITCFEKNDVERENKTINSSNNNLMVNISIFCNSKQRFLENLWKNVKRHEILHKKHFFRVRFLDSIVIPQKNVTNFTLCIAPDISFDEKRIRYASFLKFNVKSKSSQLNKNDYATDRNITFNTPDSVNSPALFKTLEDFCNHFNITKNDCNCSVTSNNETSYCDLKAETYSEYNPNFHRIYALVSCIAAVTGLIGNMIVLKVIYEQRARISLYKRLIAYLALCDWIFAAIILAKSVHLFWSATWPFGRVLCKIMEPCMNLGTYGAIGIITVISIERYIGIRNPFHSGWSAHILENAAKVNFLFSIAVLVPEAIYLDVSKDTKLCISNWPNPGLYMLSYNIFTFILYFVVPLCIIAVLYMRVTLILKHAITIMTSNNEKSYTDKHLIERRRRENQLTILKLSAVVISFVVLVFPKKVIILLYSFKGWSSTPNAMINESIYHITIYIAHLPYPFHVAINPIIYGLTNAKWLRSIKEAFLKTSRRPRSSTNVTSIFCMKSSTLGVTPNSSMGTFQNCMIYSTPSCEKYGSPFVNVKSLELKTRLSSVSSALSLEFNISQSGSL